MKTSPLPSGRSIAGGPATFGSSLFHHCRPKTAWLLVALLPVAAAAWTVPNPQPEGSIPAAAKGGNYVKGYLTLAGYFSAAGITPSDPNQATSTTQKFQQALDDAHEYNKVLLISAGTYIVNDTLRAWSATATPSGTGIGHTAGGPRRHHLAIVGSTAGARPVIKLKSNAADFDNGASESTAKPILEFRNSDLIDGTETPDWANEQAGSGYYQMLRNVDIDCNNNAGAIGLYFSQAQDSSIEDVKIIATGAFAGIRGLPARSDAITANVIIEGGKYGLDTKGLVNPNPGSTVANIQLLNQTVSAVRHTGFGVLTIAGFRIVKTGSGPALTTEASSGAAHNGGISLIDGSIELTTPPATAVIDNGNDRNFYARKVYVNLNWTSAVNLKLIKNNGVTLSTAMTRDGSTNNYWVRLREYGHRRQFGLEGSGNKRKESESLIAGNVYSGTGATGDVSTVELLVQGVVPKAPANLASKHGWAAKPFFLDSDAKDLVGLDPAGSAGVITSQSTDADGFITYQVDSAAFQTFLNNSANKKVFLRAGAYQLDDTIELKAGTILFGVDRNLTRLETNDDDWVDRTTPGYTDGVPMVTTVDDAEATTYLGDLSIGVFAGGADVDNDSNHNNVHPHDDFNALVWRAGRKSMVHIGGIYAPNHGLLPRVTNPHSLILITGNGGGRWYATGSRKAFVSDHDDYRIFRVKGSSTSTSQALSIYGMSLEHAHGTTAFASFEEAENIRIYGAKNEMIFPANPNDPVVVAWASAGSVMEFTDCTNVGVFGVSALRNALNPNKGLIHFTDCTQVLTALATPQQDDYEGVLVGPVVREKVGSASAKKIDFPNVVSLYKDQTGDINDGAVSHEFAGDYGAP